MPDRRVAPPLRHTLDFTLPKPELFLEKEGLSGWLIASDLQPVLRIEVCFRAGKIIEKQEAVSSFTASMLEKGTLNKSASQIAAILDQHSAQLEISPGMDFTTISLYCLTSNLRKVLPLFLEIISAPSFDENEFRLHCEIFLQNLQVNKEKNSYLAGQAIRGLVFGDHPYGRSTEAEDIKALTTEHLKSFFNQWYSPFSVFVSGKIEAEDLKTLNEGLQPRIIPGNAIQMPGIHKGEKRIERNESVQCSIRMGKPGISRTDNDYPAYLLTNHLLGGFFGSRLMKNIREEKGLTYGIYSGVQHLQQATMQTIGADVNKENLEAAMEAIRLELTALTDLSDEELMTAKNHFIGSMQNDVNTIFAAADKIKTLQLNQLSPSYYQELILSLDKLTIADIKKAAEIHFQPQDFSVAIAG